MTNQEAITIIGNLEDKDMLYNPCDVQDAKTMAINALEQEPKTGHWILRPHIYGVAFCSECGFELKFNNTNYCPNCGARMVEQKESEDKE